jgi:hypothetical protein
MRGVPRSANAVSAPTDALDALRLELATLAARVAALEAAAPRDEQDAELRHQLATSTQALLFRSKDLYAHGGVDAALRRALVRADCCDAEAIGLWLRRERGTRDGIRIAREGRKWRVMHVAHVTCSDAIA